MGLSDVAARLISVMQFAWRYLSFATALCAFAVELPPGYSGTVYVRYEIPTLWKCAYAVSFLTLAGIAAKAFPFSLHKRKKVI